MTNGIIGKKLGMTQVYDDQGRLTPVTVIEAGPCKVVEVRTKEKHGYESVQ
ncbi:MAG: 50S ribosomal protein L3, partial [Nitrospirae bacterium]|nr:50S ribosomal protein L3 [Nitrospirota bacterium]